VSTGPRTHVIDPEPDGGNVRNPGLNSARDGGKVRNVPLVGRETDPPAGPMVPSEQGPAALKVRGRSAGVDGHGSLFTARQSRPSSNQTPDRGNFKKE